jgi:hypothetical protein
MHAAQSEEFRLLMEVFRENPESFWQRNFKPKIEWDEQVFLNSLENYDLTPQADPNTASHGQRMMKVAALKQLQAQNPSMYDPLAIDTVALQTLGWSNPSQFLASPSAQQKPPPELLQVQSKIMTEQKEAEASMIVAQAKAAETQAKIQMGAFAPKQDGGQGQQQIDPIKLAELQLKQHELVQTHQDMLLEAENRKRDRESRERIEAMKFAEEMARNPQEQPIANSIIDSAMLKRLEGNEPPLTDMSSGVMGEGQ